MRAVGLFLGVLLLIPGLYALLSILGAIWRGGGGGDRMWVWIFCLALGVVGLVLIGDRIAARWDRRL